MGRKPKDVQQKKKQTSKAECVHYWVIESPQGPVSRGVCKYCGAVNEFRNYMPYPSWEGKMPRLPADGEMSDIEPSDDTNNSS
jgi:hypothetical protein